MIGCPEALAPKIIQILVATENESSLSEWWLAPWQNLQDGMTETSAVTTLSRPRLHNAPLTTPHEKARYWIRNTQQKQNSFNNTDSCRLHFDYIMFVYYSVCYSILYVPSYLLKIWN